MFALPKLNHHGYTIMVQLLPYSTPPLTASRPCTIIGDDGKEVFDNWHRRLFQGKEVSVFLVTNGLCVLHRCSCQI